MKTRLLSLLVGACVCACSATLVHAEVLMLDFGATSATGANLTNSPYHSAGGSSGLAKWNDIGASDMMSGLFFGNNTSATGVSVNTGVSSGTSTTINLAANTISLLTGTASNAASTIYATDSVGRDGIFTNSTANPGIGLQIGGLAAGTYDIYIAARNTNVGNNQPGYSQIVYAGTSAASGDFAYNDLGYVSSSLVYEANQNPATYRTTSWVLGENYVRLSVTLSANEYLNLAVTGAGTERGFLNSVQIVSAIPEPSVFAVLGGLAAIACVALRRRRG